MFLMIGKLPFYCISKMAIIAIKPEKILLTIGFIVMIIGKPLAPCWLPGLRPVSRHRRKSQLSPETRAVSADVRGDDRHYQCSDNKINIQEKTLLPELIFSKEPI